jgi:predicted alpha/beta-fold hydrolase
VDRLLAAQLAPSLYRASRGHAALRALRPHERETQNDTALLAARMGPGATLHDYYRACSSLSDLLLSEDDDEPPLLLLTSRDDPVIPGERSARDAAAVAASPACARGACRLAVITARGGHLGWHSAARARAAAAGAAAVLPWSLDCVMQFFFPGMNE